eukprot:10373896-Heterocapsa_arctica.AAC.1
MPSKRERRARYPSAGLSPAGRPPVGLLVKNSLSVLVGVLAGSRLVVAGWGGEVLEAACPACSGAATGGAPRGEPSMCAPPEPSMVSSSPGIPIFGESP